MTAVSMLMIGAVVTTNLSGFALKALTVPANQLPRGCRLAPVPRSATGEPQVIGFPNLTENPWVGTESQELAAIRWMIEGQPSLAEPGAVDKQSDGVTEGYRAIYLTADRRKIDVYALRFTEPDLTAKALLSELAGGHRILVRGSVAVLVRPSEGGDCHRAVISYLASVKGVGEARR